MVEKEVRGLVFYLSGVCVWNSSLAWTSQIMAKKGSPRRRLKSNFDATTTICGVRVDTTYWQRYAVGTFFLLLIGVHLLQDAALYPSSQNKREQIRASALAGLAPGASLKSGQAKCIDGLIWCEREQTCVTPIIIEQGIFECDGPPKKKEDNSAMQSLRAQHVQEIETSFDDEYIVTGVDAEADADASDDKEDGADAATDGYDGGEDAAQDSDAAINDASVVDRISKSESPLSASQRPPIDTNVAVGNREVGGVYDGSTVLLYSQMQRPVGAKTLNYQNAASKDGIKNFTPLKSHLKSKGWSYANQAPKDRVALFFSRGSTPSRLKPGFQMVNTIGYSGCIGGNKALQLRCRKRLATKFGCDYDTLGIQPPQYSMDKLDECKSWYKRASMPENAEKMWIAKPTYTFHGAGIKVHKGISVLGPKYGACAKQSPLVIMDYIENPATVQGGYKFDMRTYLLVASLKPKLVFYHDGFARKSDAKYTSDTKNKNVHVTNAVSQSGADHFWSFERISEALHEEHGFPPNFLASKREYMEKVTKFLFMTTAVQDNPLRYVPGRFQVFAIDWMVSMDQKLHVLEGNGYPLVTNYKDLPELTPQIWDNMMDLVLKVQFTPEELPPKFTTAAKYRHGGWSMVYNELEYMYRESKQLPSDFDACEPLDV